mmetsp:Transcript_10724/g.37523  ORF Transcript_10724/g.37523 Transcript_10724/m.37523 type:complete len:242 (+) Transcript_10724:819-1544(+)
MKSSNVTGPRPASRQLFCPSTYTSLAGSYKTYLRLSNNSDSTFFTTSSGEASDFDPDTSRKKSMSSFSPYASATKRSITARSSSDACASKVAAFACSFNLFTKPVISSTKLDAELSTKGSFTRMKWYKPMAAAFGCPETNLVGLPETQFAPRKATSQAASSTGLTRSFIRCTCSSVCGVSSKRASMMSARPHTRELSTWMPMSGGNRISRSCPYWLSQLMSAPRPAIPCFISKSVDAAPWA